MARKLKAGFFSFTGDEGCMIVLLELISDRFDELSQKMEIAYWHVLSPKKWRDIEEFDVAIIEGAVSTNREVEKLKDIRSRAKKLVAVGTCATTGAPSNYRNFFDERRLGEIDSVIRRFGYREKVQPLKDFVKVDDEVPGCPVMEEPFLQVMQKYFKEFGVG